MRCVERLWSASRTESWRVHALHLEERAPMGLGDVEVMGRWGIYLGPRRVQVLF